jgi:hypothetical protein
MIKIDSNIINLVKEVKEVHDHITIFIDYDKEEKYSDLKDKLSGELDKLNEDLSPNDKDGIIQVIQESENVQRFYLYDRDEIIEILFPLGTGKDSIIKSAYNWIEPTSRIEWIMLNVLDVASSKKYYGKVDNINDNWILSSIKL